jgi:UV DNA damage endonuclease
MNLGYCCINLTLKPDGISTNRGMIKRTFKEKGIEYAGEVALSNIIDLQKILAWNLERDIMVFRMSSSLFPWMSEYEFEDLPNFTEIKSELEKVGRFVQKHGMRVGFHPGQFNVLPSPRPHVVENCITDLNQHAKILDLMQLPQTVQYSLNIHVGGSFKEKDQSDQEARDQTLIRFCQNFSRLSESVQKRLVIENDDKATQYGVQDLYDGIYKKIGIPITFDFFHHLFCPNDLTIEQAAELAASTWPDGIRPLAHYSSSKKINEDQDTKSPRSHADWVWEPMPDIASRFDIEIEAKAKDLALLKYREQYLKKINKDECTRV